MELSEQDKQRIEVEARVFGNINPEAIIDEEERYYNNNLLPYDAFIKGATYEHSHLSDLLVSQSKEIEQMVQSAQNYVNGEKLRYEEFCRMQKEIESLRIANEASANMYGDLLNKKSGLHKEIELLRNTYNALDKAHQTSSDNVQTLLKEIAEKDKRIADLEEFIKQSNGKLIFKM